MARFKPGKTINSFDELDLLISAGRWLCLRGRPVHPRFIDQMSFETIRKFMVGGSLRIAEETEENDHPITKQRRALLIEVK